jgi:hypothetical protein
MITVLTRYSGRSSRPPTFPEQALPLSIRHTHCRSSLL